MLFRSKNTDTIFTFYYDETNNIRKLYLTENGFNGEKSDNFVLAGIAHEGKDSTSDFREIIKMLKLPPTAKELKLKYIGKKDIPTILKSTKLRTLLNWLNESDCYIHYCNLDVLYWSIVDIIDSMVVETPKPFSDHFAQHNLLLKNTLYMLIRNDLDSFLEKLHSVGYPDIKPEMVSSFIEWIAAFSEQNKHGVPHAQYYMLKGLFDLALKSEELPFIMNEKEGELINNFMIFYLQHPMMFINSIHIFDEEHQVQALIKEYEKDNHQAKLGQYSFQDSKTNYAIQISDVIAGLLGKYFTFINDNSASSLIEFKNCMSDIQCDNMRLLKALIDKSDSKSAAFLQSVTSLEDNYKNMVFMHDYPDSAV